MRLTMKARQLGGGSFLGLMLAASPNASGQETAQQDASPQQTGIQDIVVTANRTTENVQNVPLSITAISQSEIASERIQSTSDPARLVPPVTPPRTPEERRACGGSRAGRDMKM